MSHHYHEHLHSNMGDGVGGDQGEGELFNRPPFIHEGEFHHPDNHPMGEFHHDAEGGGTCLFELVAIQNVPYR